MKFKLYAYLAITAFLAVSAVTGALPLQAAFVLFVVSAACLATYNPRVLATCPDYFAGLRIATEHLGDEIHGFPSIATPYYNSQVRGTFAKNTGVTQTTFIAGRVEPTSKSAGWSDVSLSNNVVTGGACSDSFTQIGVGFDEATFAPRKLQLQGPPLCRDTFTYAHNPMSFIQGKYVPRLSQYVKRKVDLEFRDQTIKLGNKMPIAAGAFDSFVFTGTTLPTVAPQSQITWDWLDDLAAYLIRDGAADDDEGTIEVGPEGPVFEIRMGLEMLRKLFTNVDAQRLDYRSADQGRGDASRTLLAVGQTVRVKNWRFTPVTHPPRYDFVGGILVEREAFEDVSATHGTKSQLTAAYKNAEFEAAVQPHPRQFSANVVSPDNAGLEFDATSWSGEWKFVTGGNQLALNSVCYDPLHKWGAHFSEYVYAPEPIHTSYSWTLFYSRCKNGQARTSCTATYNP